MFGVIRLKSIIIGVMLVFLSVILSVSAIKVIKIEATPKAEYVIVIDAGHGGIDGGAVGQNGSVESELNLKYSQELKKLCEEIGFEVVMTRSDMDGLYSPTAENKKRSEMENRERIINESGADFMVSIHMNSFSLSSCRGAQVFYDYGDEDGKRFAESVQNSLFSNINFAKKNASVGDYYVLNCAKMPAILIECGYLSNPEEEKQLNSDEYRNLFCQTVLVGILNYLDM